MKNYHLIFFFFICAGTHKSFGQNVLQVSELSTSKITTIKKGDNVQFYYALPDNENTFIYGAVRQITDTHITLRNGAEISVERILNVDRIPLGRSLPVAALFGVGIGVVGIATGATVLVAAVAGTPAVTFTLFHTLMYNRRHLKRNEVGRTVELRVAPMSDGLKYGMAK